MRPSWMMTHSSARSPVLPQHLAPPPDGWASPPHPGCGADSPPRVPPGRTPSHGTPWTPHGWGAAVAGSAPRHWSSAAVPRNPGPAAPPGRPGCRTPASRSDDGFPSLLVGHGGHIAPGLVQQQVYRSPAPGPGERRPARMSSVSGSACWPSWAVSPLTVIRPAVRYPSAARREQTPGGGQYFLQSLFHVSPTPPPSGGFLIQAAPASGCSGAEASFGITVRPAARGTRPHFRSVQAEHRRAHHRPGGNRALTSGSVQADLRGQLLRCCRRPAEALPGNQRHAGTDAAARQMPRSAPVPGRRRSWPGKRKSRIHAGAWWSAQSLPSCSGHGDQPLAVFLRTAHQRPPSSLCIAGFQPQAVIHITQQLVVVAAWSARRW